MRRPPVDRASACRGCPTGLMIHERIRPMTHTEITRSEVRDGKPYAPLELEAFDLLPDAAEAAQALHAAGWRLIVVTNQPDVGRGVLRHDVLEQMHAQLRSLLPLDDIRVCCHLDADACECRKPRCGLLLAAAVE